MATGTVGEESQLLLLDPIFHLPSGAVDLVMDLLRTAFEGADDKARVGAQGMVFSLDDNAAGAIPRAGPILDPTKLPLLAWVLLEGLLSSLHQGPRQCQEPLVFGQTNNVIHVVAFAPTKHLPTAEARVGPQDDPHLGPLLAQAGGEQFEDGPGVLGRIDVAGAQVTDQ